MNQFLRGFRPLLAGFSIAILIYAAFCGIISPTASAEGGGSGPMPSDTLIPVSSIPIEYGTDPDEVSIFTTALIVFSNVL